MSADSLQDLVASLNLFWSNAAQDSSSDPASAAVGAPAGASSVASVGFKTQQASSAVKATADSGQDCQAGVGTPAALQRQVPADLQGNPGTAAAAGYGQDSQPSQPGTATPAGLQEAVRGRQQAGNSAGAACVQANASDSCQGLSAVSPPGDDHQGIGASPGAFAGLHDRWETDMEEAASAGEAAVAAAGYAALLRAVTAGAAECVDSPNAAWFYQSMLHALAAHLEPLCDDAMDRLRAACPTRAAACGGDAAGSATVSSGATAPAGASGSDAAGSATVSSGATATADASGSDAAGSATVSSGATAPAGAAGTSGAAAPGVCSTLPASSLTSRCGAATPPPQRSADATSGNGAPAWTGNPDFDRLLSSTAASGAARAALAEALRRAGVLRACCAALKPLAAGKATALSPDQQGSLAVAALRVLRCLCLLAPLRSEILNSGAVLYAVRLATSAPGSLPIEKDCRMGALSTLVVLCGADGPSNALPDDSAQRACQLCSRLGAVPAILAALAASPPGMWGAQRELRTTYRSAALELRTTYLSAALGRCSLAKACFKMDAACLDRKGCLAALLAVMSALDDPAWSGAPTRLNQTTNSSLAPGTLEEHVVASLADVLCLGLANSTQFRQQALMPELVGGATSWLCALLALGRAAPGGAKTDAFLHPLAAPERAVSACKALEELLLDGSGNARLCNALDNKQHVVRIWDHLYHVVDQPGGAAAVQTALAVTHAVTLGTAARRHACKPANLQLLCKVLMRSEYVAEVRSLAGQVVAELLLEPAELLTSAASMSVHDMNAHNTRIADALAAAGAASSLVNLMCELIEQSALATSITIRALQQDTGVGDACPDYTVIVRMLWLLVVAESKRITADLYSAGLAEAVVAGLRSWLTAAPDVAPPRHVEKAVELSLIIMANRRDRQAGEDFEDLALVAMAVKQAWNKPEQGQPPLPYVVHTAVSILKRRLAAAAGPESEASRVLLQLSTSGCLKIIVEQLERAAPASQRLADTEWEAWLKPLVGLLEFLGAAYTIPLHDGHAGLEHGRALAAVMKIWKHGVEPILRKAAARVARDCPRTDCGRRDLLTTCEQDAMEVASAVATFVGTISNSSACGIQWLSDMASMIVGSFERHDILFNTMDRWTAGNFQNQFAAFGEALDARTAAGLPNNSAHSSAARPTDADVSMAALLQEEEAARAQRDAALGRAARKKAKKKRAKATAASGPQSSEPSAEPAMSAHAQPGVEARASAGGGSAIQAAMAPAAAPSEAADAIATLQLQPSQGAQTPSALLCDEYTSNVLHLASEVQAADSSSSQPGGQRTSHSSSGVAAAAAQCAAVRAPGNGTASASHAAELPCSGRALRTPAGCPALAPAITKGGSRHDSALDSRVDARARDDDVGLDEDLFCCPITHEVMADPVILADGITYERSAVVRWLACHDSSPMTNQALLHKQLVPNLAVRQAIAALQSLTL